MCLTLGKIKRKKTAFEDMVVYKYLVRKGWLFHRYYAPFYGEFRYKIGETYETELVKEEGIMGDPDIVNEGFHSFENLSDCVNVATATGSLAGCTIVVGKFIIPKGAKYYEGTKWYNGYASDKIKFVEVVDVV